MGSQHRTLSSHENLHQPDFAGSIVKVFSCSLITSVEYNPALRPRESSLPPGLDIYTLCTVPRMVPLPPLYPTPLHFAFWPSQEFLTNPSSLPRPNRT